MIKLCLLSDTHTKHESFVIPECDILVYAGDFTNQGSGSDIVAFTNWLEIQPAKHIVFIAGNHDLGMDPHHLNFSKKLFNVWLNALPDHIHYLQDSGIEIMGLKFWGSPYSPTFGRGWAFNADRGEVIKKIWKQIPLDTNVLVTHSPPMYTLDEIPEEYVQVGETKNRGCFDLTMELKRLHNLKLHVFGHIHDNWGIVTKKVSLNRRLTYANAALLTNNYTQLHKYPLIHYI